MNKANEYNSLIEAQKKEEMIKNADYKKGFTINLETHIAIFGLVLTPENGFDLDKKYCVKVMGEDEQRTGEQNSTFWKVLGIIKRLGIETKINSKGKEIPKNEEEMLTTFMYNLKHLDKMILGYRYVKDGRLLKTVKEEIAELGTDKEPVRNSTTKIGKRRFSELIKYVLDYCDGNIPNMSNADHKEYCILREQLSNNSVERLRDNA